LKGKTGTLLVLVLVFFFGCKKENKETYFYVYDSIKDWVYFSEGSYWVCLNEKTNKERSCYLNMIPTHGFAPPAGEGSIHFEGYYYDLTSSLIPWVSITCDPSNSYAELGSFYQSGLGFIALTSGITKNILARTKGCSVDSTPCQLVEIIDTLQLNNNRFFNVIHTRASYQYYGNFQNDYYFAKDVGLIKFRIKASSIDTTWSLLRWHTRKIQGNF
jgi:hypothetical protein